MRAYGGSIVNDYVRLIGHSKLKKVSTPFLSKTAMIEDSPAKGELAGSASSVLMKLTWLARLSRPDMLRVTTWLATKVQQWTTECDNLLFRAISYLNETKDHLLTGHVGDDLHDIYVELFCDADFCGDDEHTYSTTGGWVQLSGKNTSFPLTWMSKKQGAVSRSTPEAEAAAMATTLFDEGLPLLELVSVLFRKSVRLLIREDNEATAKVVSAGYSKRLRHMKRTHRINLGSLKEELDKDDVELQLVASRYQKTDIFAKGLAGEPWGPALDLLVPRTLVWRCKRILMNLCSLRTLMPSQYLYLLRTIRSLRPMWRRGIRRRLHAFFHTRKLQKTRLVSIEPLAGVTREGGVEITRITPMPCMHVYRSCCHWL